MTKNRYNVLIKIGDNYLYDYEYRFIECSRFREAAKVINVIDDRAYFDRIMAVIKLRGLQFELVWANRKK